MSHVIHTLDVKLVTSDAYITGMYGFTITDEDQIVVYRSSLAYSSEHDAEQAGEDAVATAQNWRKDRYIRLEL